MRPVSRVSVYDPKRIEVENQPKGPDAGNPSRASAKSKKVVKWELRWMVYFSDKAKPARRSCQREFSSKEAALEYGRKVRAAELGGTDDRTGYPFGWNDRYWPIILMPEVKKALTVWELLQKWRTRYYHQKAAQTRAMERTAVRRPLTFYVRNAGKGIPEVVTAYLSAVAFRKAEEPATLEDLRAIHPSGIIVWRQTPKIHRKMSVEEIWEGRKWLDENSSPVTEINADTLSKLSATYPKTSKASVRNWELWRAIIAFAVEEQMLPEEMIKRVGKATPAIELSKSVQFEAVPTVAEQWHFSDWLASRERGRGRGGKAGTHERFRSLPLVLGGAGLRIGEALILRRKNIAEEPETGGMMITVRRSVSHPVKDFTDDGAGGPDERGTKGRGGGNTKGRTTYLPPREAAVLREHLKTLPGDPEALIWPNINGAPLRLSNLASSIWGPAAKEAFPAGHRLHGVGRHAFRGRSIYT